MIAERWAALKQLFEQAMEMDEAERLAFVDGACAGDPSMELSLLQLLAHHDAAASVLAGPVLSMKRAAEIVGSGMRTFVPGEVVAGRFRVERFLAEGGMGEVYAAADLELGGQVALKTIRPLLTRSEEILARFKQEIQLARLVTHAHVARVYDLFRHEVELDGQRRSIVFLSMELLDGGTLAERLRREGPLKHEHALVVARQLAAALDAAHAAGVVHRDFKSGNVVLARNLDGSERAVIMDFGLSAAARPLPESPLSEWDSGRMERGAMEGTPMYMAPEQVGGAPVGPAADIYSFGIVVYEMLAGQPPFQGTTSMETAWLRMTQDAPALHGVPRRWNDAVQACLTRDPAGRPASAEAVVRRMEGRFAWTAARRRAALALAAMVLIAVAVWVVRRPHQPTAEALLAADVARVKQSAQTKQGHVEAVEGFRKATELDPQWAQAWAELSYEYATAANAASLPPALATKEARRAAAEAIRLDSHSSRAYGALGWVQSLDLEEWPKAEQSFQRAVELDANDWQIHYWFGVHLRKRGRYRDAETHDRLALTLSRQKEPMVWCELAFLYWTSGRLDRMQQHLREQLVAFPNFGLTRYLNARLLKHQGRYAEAQEELDFTAKLQYPAVTVMAERASLEAFRGRPDEARRLLARLEEISRTGSVDGLLIAGVYAQLGDADQAMAWLDRAYERRDTTLLSIATSPVLKPLHGDARFVALLRRLHFDDQIMQQMGFNSSSVSGAGSQPRRGGQS
ncbi:protein kinase domain-containing protein [Paludibaculum fermentans]|uniref:Protein kinase n=1 Tax=Paludibaculum fermentans TaxID=1473598 RepID=A0A7S7NT91_PALFE|nr:protein kinase [Paludibaculum fermentans]QOY88829.1 protein kinase [Paludibaculum fermentans]